MMAHKLRFERFDGYLYAYLDDEPCRHPEYLKILLPPTTRRKERILTPEEYRLAKCFCFIPGPYIKTILFPFLTVRIRDEIFEFIRCFNHCNGKHKGKLCLFTLKSENLSLRLFSFYSAFDEPLPLPNEPSYHDPIATLFFRCLLLNDESIKRFLLENTEQVARWLELLIAIDEGVIAYTESIQLTDTYSLNYVDPYIALGALIYNGGAPFVSNLLFVPDPPPSSPSFPVTIKKTLKKIPEIVELLLLPNFFANLNLSKIKVIRRD